MFPCASMFVLAAALLVTGLSLGTCRIAMPVCGLSYWTRSDRVGPPVCSAHSRCIGYLLARCCVITVLLSPLPALSGELWLSGFDPVVRSVVEPGMVSDYFDIFDPDASWYRAASRVRVFKIAGALALSGSEQKLLRLFADLQRRHISLALEISALTARGGCGEKIEGYAPSGELARMVERIRRLGGDLQFVAMDEPLWNGHEFSGANACHTSISAVAADVAANLSSIRRVFPAVRVGDIEQIGRISPSDLTDQIMQWTKAYQDAFGEPLAFVHFDVVWGGPWQQQLTILVHRLHVAGIKFGIIYNGDPSDQTDLAWTGHAEHRFAEVEADAALIPDQAILQTWMVHPSRMLPETEPGTMTWLVNRYFAAETRLVLRQVGGKLVGQLTDTAGQPRAGAPITLAAEVVGTPEALAVHAQSGRVPPNATSAVLALRVNAECDCSGPADVDVGPFRYSDDSSGRTAELRFGIGSALGSGAGVSHIQARSGQAIIQNTPRFSVTADRPFTVQVPMRTNQASEGSGYVALIFLNAQLKEVERLRFAFRPAERPIGAVTTDATGRFSLLANHETVRSSVGFRAEFRGDEQDRAASASLRQ
jgi:hypothetical protein